SKPPVQPANKKPAATKTVKVFADMTRQQAIENGALDLFDRIDSNHDGVATVDEIKTYKQNKQANNTPANQQTPPAQKTPTKKKTSKSSTNKPTTTPTEGGFITRAMRRGRTSSTTSSDITPTRNISAAIVSSAKTNRRSSKNRRVERSESITDIINKSGWFRVGYSPTNASLEKYRRSAKTTFTKAEGQAESNKIPMLKRAWYAKKHAATNTNTNNNVEDAILNELNAHAERLRNNQFNDYERNVLGYHENMTEEEIKKAAKEALQYTALASYVDDLENAKQKGDQTGDYSEYNELVRNLNTLQAESSDVSRVQEIINVYAIIEADDAHKAEVANTVATSARMQCDDDEINGLLSETVFTYANSEAAIETFVTNNTEKEDVINRAAQKVSEEYPEIADRINLKQVIARGFKKAEDMGVQLPSKRNPSANSNPSETISRQQAEVASVAEIREASNAIYSDRNTDVETESRDIQAELSQFSEQITSVNRTTNPIERAQIKKEITQHLGNILKDISKIDDNEEKSEFVELVRNHLRQTTNDTLFTMYLTGSNEVREFMKDLIDMDALFHYLDTHPAEKKTASPDILELYQEHLEENAEV
ncbi:MAG: hypothetical protein NC200_05475, partial [Candidatus Gastranaerophilales bacterium]|nr:hypothetical protein [Candidatus Gastranaerophilales bacterium]